MTICFIVGSKRICSHLSQNFGGNLSKKNPISGEPDIGFIRYSKVLSHYQARRF
jgi:hypothetical protein